MPDKQHLSGNNDKTSLDDTQKETLVDLDRYRWWRTGQHLRSKLADFADHETLMDELDSARERFYSVIDLDLLDYEDEFLRERFYEWFIFDYRMRGRTLLEYVTVAGNLSDSEVALLKKWGKARCSLYQVIKVQNKSVILKDVLRNTETEVADPDIVQELVPGQLLFIRIIPVGDLYEFSTGGLILPFYSKDYIISRINLDAELFWSNRTKRGKWDVFLQRRAHVINAMVMETASAVWGLGENYNQECRDDLGHGDVPQQVIHRAKKLFLDCFYERWINEPMDVLQGQTPLEASRTQPGRDKLRTLLRELLQIEEQQAAKGEPAYDLAKICQKLGLVLDLTENERQQLTSQRDTEQSYPKVSELIRQGLLEIGYQSKQIKAVEKMWLDYSKLKSPAFKKPESWAAAVIYAVTKSTGNKLFSQSALAVKYNVSASTISSNSRSFYRTLQKNKLWNL